MELLGYMLPAWAEKEEKLNDDLEFSDNEYEEEDQELEDDEF